MTSTTGQANFFLEKASWDVIQVTHQFVEILSLKSTFITPQYSYYLIERIKKQNIEFIASELQERFFYLFFTAILMQCFRERLRRMFHFSGWFRMIVRGLDDKFTCY